MRVDLRSWWVRLGAVYVVVASSLATAAQVTHDGRFYLAALLVTLPLGVAAILGVYLCFGVTVQLVTALSSGLTADQISGRTLAITAPINVLLFAVAAAANVRLLHGSFAGTCGWTRRSGRRS